MPKMSCSPYRTIAGPAYAEAGQHGRVLAGHCPIRSDHGVGGAAAEPVLIRVWRTAGIEEVVVPGLGHDMPHRPVTYGAGRA